MNPETTRIDFTKMHGAGNDYVYINGMEHVPEHLPELAIAISDRHFGVGSDGLVVIMPSARADFRMRMFNADGSEAEMCGNASRCIGKYVYDRKLTDKESVTLETLAGVKVLRLHIENGEVASVTVDMNAPILTPSLIPALSSNENHKISETESINGKEYDITAVGMGNPHAVVFCGNVTDALVLGDGPVLERADIFPRKANIEFAHVGDRRNIDMRVWERGSGETLACGTGACATLVAAVLNGLTERRATIHLLGGDLDVEWSEADNHVYLTGPAEFIADGTFYFRKKTLSSENIMQQ